MERRKQQKCLLEESSTSTCIAYETKAKKNCDETVVRNGRDMQLLAVELCLFSLVQLFWTLVVASLDIVSGEPRRTRDLINRQYYWPFSLLL
jgi:hypothetical protein